MASQHTQQAWQWQATGTIWRIHHDGTVAAAAAERVRELVRRDEARWSRFDASSETSRISRGAGRDVIVSNETLALVEACIAWTQRSGGAFQPLVGGALTAWGYRRPLQEASPAIAGPPPTGAVCGQITVDREHGSVRIPPGATLDLGGIAKGWMADRAGRLLAGCGGRTLVDAGGDLLAVAGDHAVLAAHPGMPPITVQLPAGWALATSGPSARSWPCGEATAHHLIDPASGAPADAVHATVMASSCTEADVMATVLALRPRLVAVGALPALVTEGRRLHHSPSWKSVAA